MRAPFALLARIRVTVIYAVILTAVSVALSRLDPGMQDRVIEGASTNLHNLARGHVDTLVTSALVADAGPEYQWVPGLVFLLAVGELLWGSKRLLVKLAVSHVGATLLVAAWLVVGVASEGHRATRNDVTASELLHRNSSSLFGPETRMSIGAGWPGSTAPSVPAATPT